MRFMLIVKATPDSEAGVPPTKELIEQMMAFNEEMVNAGVMLAGEGLQPSHKGARVVWSAQGGKPQVKDGPFAETKELIAGFWLIQVRSREEAIEWARRCPAPMGPGQEAVIEVRQVFEAEDFPSESLTPELAQKEQELRDRTARQQGK